MSRYVPITAPLLGLALALGILALEVGRGDGAPDAVASATPATSATVEADATPQSVRGRDEPFASIGREWARALLVGTHSPASPEIAATDDGTFVVAANAMGFQPDGAWAYTDFRPNPTGTPLEFHGGDYDIVLAAFGSDGEGLWSRSFGGPGTDYVGSLALAGNGDILLSGTYTGTIDLGSGPVPADGPRNGGWRDGFLARFDPKGNLRWSRTFGLEQSASASALAELPDGTLVVVGQSSAPVIAIGDLELATNGQQQAFVVGFTPDGEVAWATSLDSTYGGRMVVDAENSEVLIALHERPENRARLAFHGLVRLSADGEIVSRSAPPVWPSGEIASAGASGLEIAPDGSIVLGGTFEGQVDFGGGVLTAATFGSPYVEYPTDGFIARFSADGTHRMSMTVDKPREGIEALALDANGDILIAARSYIERRGPDGELKSAIPFPEVPSLGWDSGGPESASLRSSSVASRLGTLLVDTPATEPGEVIVGGRFQDRLAFEFGGRILTKRIDDAFIARVEAP